MKNSIKIHIVSFYFLLLTSLFLINSLSVSANSPSDYFTEVAPDGEVTSGTIFYPDKRTIRPEYQGTWESLLSDITDSTGKPYFTSYGKKQKYKKGEFFYYNNVGTHLNRGLSLKIDYLVGPVSSDLVLSYVVQLNLDGSINQSTMNRDVESGEGMISYQLVYTDTKEVVKDVYLEFPQIIYNHQATSQVAPNHSYDTFGLDGLKKVYLQKTDKNGMDSKLTNMTGNITGRNLIKAVLSPAFSALIPQNFVVVSDNNLPMTIGIYSAFAYNTSFNIFSSSVPVPGVPTYNAPMIEGKSNSQDFRGSYTINQPLSSTYDQYYPDYVTIVVEDKEKIFSTIEPAAIQLFDREKRDLTQRAIIRNLSANKVSMSLPSSLLRELKSNNVSIQLDTDKLALEKVLSLYDASSGLIKLPLTAYTIRENNGEKIETEESLGEMSIEARLAADAVPQTVPIGSSTKDLDLNELVKNITSNLPEDKVSITGFTEEKKFDTVKKDSVAVQIQSQRLPELIKTITIPINVTDDLVMPSFFENQSWLIDNINEQLTPKQVGKNLYMSDLNKLTNITITSADDGIKGQFIPKNIYHIRNLETLSLVNTQLSGNLPKELGQLSKVRALILNGNTFTGGIPESFAEIETLETLNLKSNKLTGKIPTSLTSLENLTKLNVSENDFIGELPYFNDAFAEINVAKNQLTINSEKIPSFLTGPNAYYEDTFIQGLQLAAKNAISIKGKDISMIKPFDEADQGYFNLHALGEKEIPLVDGHIYTILDEATNEILYEGYWDKEQAIPYAKGMGYTVILDNAALNPNNQCMVKTKIPELKLETIPSALAFDIALGNDLKKPVEMIGALAVFDNRDEGNWKLGITPSLLESETKTLKGEYSYINSSGAETSIITNQKAFIEKGVSDAENERIPVSDKWNGKRGLQYTMNGSNYLGNYKGSVTWTLEDVPTSN